MILHRKEYRWRLYRAGEPVGMGEVCIDRVIAERELHERLGPGLTGTIEQRGGIGQQTTFREIFRVSRK